MNIGVFQFNSIYFADNQENKNTKTIHMQDIHAQNVLMHKYAYLFIHITCSLRNVVKFIFCKFLANK